MNKKQYKKKYKNPSSSMFLHYTTLALFIITLDVNLSHDSFIYSFLSVNENDEPHLFHSSFFCCCFIHFPFDSKAPGSSVFYFLVYFTIPHFYCLDCCDLVAIVIVSFLFALLCSILLFFLVDSAST